MQPGNIYKPSNHYSFIRANIFLFLGLYISIIFGRLYAIITIYNPIIYLHLIVLFGLIILLSATFALLIEQSQSQNTMVNITMVFILCTTAWLAHWAQLKCYFFNHTIALTGGVKLSFWQSFLAFVDTIDFATNYANQRQFIISGSSVLSANWFSPIVLHVFYVLEVLFFLTPLHFGFRFKHYYCPNCNKKLISLKGFADISSLVISNHAKIKNGNFAFLEDTHFFANSTDAYMHKNVFNLICGIEMHYCESCNTNAIVNINEGELKQNKDGLTFFMQKKYIVEDMYIDEVSKASFKMQLWK